MQHNGMCSGECVLNYHEKAMPVLAKRSDTKNQSFNYVFSQKNKHARSQSLALGSHTYTKILDLSAKNSISQPIPEDFWYLCWYKFLSISISMIQYPGIGIGKSSGISNSNNL